MMIRLIIAFLLAFALGVVFTGFEIPILKKKQMGQNIREEGPESHKAKAGTPSMGGVAIILAILITTIVLAGFNMETNLCLVMLLMFGLIGFADDYIKVIRKNNLGLRAWQKFSLQVVFSIVIAIWAARVFGTTVYIPFADRVADFGFWYIPFVAFAIVAMTNAVNLTDGLDGLASGCTLIVALFFGFAASMIIDTWTAVFSFAIAGACLGFLMYNKNPAKVFMGDTGSLALGGAITAASITTRYELMLLIVGLVYVIEALSVIIQVISFQTTGKRVFRMSPIHHHFELGGMKEKSVVLMFWIFTLVCGLIGLGIVGF